jgi:hypothetical protein
MNTLLIYHTTRSNVRAMCEATTSEGVDVLELRPRYRKRPLLDDLGGCYRALTGRGVRLAPLDIDFAKYDQITLVDSLVAFAPSAACNEFLYRCDLGGREVSCIVSSPLRYFGRADRLLCKRIRLAGGVCRGITFINEADFGRLPEPANVLALLKQG